MKDEYVLKVDNLTKVYPNGKIAVDNVSFAIKRGEIFGLLGPNGSGKTTTILMLLGMLDPTKGEISVLGYNPLISPLQIKRKVSYLPDSVGFYTNLTAYENIDYTTQFLNLDGKERNNRIEAALKKMRLYKKRNDKVKTFSHGMQQRLGLAEILIKQPTIAILDEPTQGLDPESVSEFLNIIKSFRDEYRMSVILSSHQLNQVQSVCNEVGLFSNGKLISHGSVNQLSLARFGKDKLVDITLDEDYDITSIANSIDGVKEVNKKEEVLK